MSEPVPPGIVLLAITFAAMALWRLIVWVRAAPIHPNPWTAQIDCDLQQPEATPICHHCLIPQPPGAWFCPNCGCATGPYNNVMPYICFFSYGEVLRNGLNQRIENRAFIFLGYVFVSMWFWIVLGPIYIFLLARRFYEQAHTHAPSQAPSSPHP